MVDEIKAKYNPKGFWQVVRKTPKGAWEVITNSTYTLRETVDELIEWFVENYPHKYKKSTK